MERREETALGKFYKAMQRAANSPDEPSATSRLGRQESAQPEIDEAFLEPEGPEIIRILPFCIKKFNPNFYTYIELML